MVTEQAQQTFWLYDDFMREGFWNNPRQIAKIMMVGSLSFPLLLLLANYAPYAYASLIGFLLFMTIILVPFSLLIHMSGILLYWFYISEAFDKRAHSRKIARFGWLISLLYNLAGVIVYSFLKDPFQMFATFRDVLDGVLFVWLVLASMLSAVALNNSISKQVGNVNGMFQDFWNNPKKIARVLIVGNLVLIGTVIKSVYEGWLAIITGIVGLMAIGWIVSILGLSLFAFYVSQSFKNIPRRNRYLSFGWRMSAYYNLIGFLLYCVSIFIVMFTEGIISGIEGNIRYMIISFWTLIAFIMSLAALRVKTEV